MRKYIFSRRMLILIAVFIFILPYISSSAKTETGLYEYIRKAEKYIDEGKFDKGLFLLHKAYEELPESEKIKDHLIYGYIKYARDLDKNNDLDKAIDELTIALEMDNKNEILVNDISYLYAKKGINLIKEGWEEDGAEYIKKSVNTAIESKNGKIKQNISNYFFNKAVEAQNENQGTIAIKCLENSYMLRARVNTLIMLGELHYIKRDLEKALFYWVKARAAKPEDRDIAEKIEKTVKEIELAKSMKTVESTHFEVKFYKDYDIDQENLKNVLDEVYYSVGKDLGYYPSSENVIIFYNVEDFRDVFKKEGIVRAFYDGTIRMIFSDNEDEKLFKAVIAHEYTHAIISIITNNNCPVWLHEGLAVTEQSKYAPIDLAQLKNFTKSGNQLRIVFVNSGFGDIHDNKAASLSYEASYSAVSFMIDKWGWKGVEGILTRLKDGTHIVNAIDEEFHISLASFEEMWNEYLNEHITYTTTVPITE